MRRTVCLSKGVGAGGAAVGRAYHRSCSGRRGYRQLRPRRRQEAGSVALPACAGRLARDTPQPLRGLGGGGVVLSVRTARLHLSACRLIAPCHPRLVSRHSVSSQMLL